MPDLIEIDEIPGACGFAPQGQRASAPGPDEGDRRFADPLVCQIVELWRLRQDMVRAEVSLTLQVHAVLRRFCGGDKKEAEKLYRSMLNGREHPLADAAYVACLPWLEARRPFKKARAAQERQLEKLAAGLPIAFVASEIRGFGLLALAKVVGECGDLSAYRDHSALWKRCGLAVIDGQRQRRVANAEAALVHGYSPSRRAVIWNIGEALFKLQGKGEAAGPYRRLYDARRPLEDVRCKRPAHAHASALRYMSKRLIRDLYRTWCAVARGEPAVFHPPVAPVYELGEGATWRLPGGHRAGAPSPAPSGGAAEVDVPSGRVTVAAPPDPAAAEAISQPPEGRDDRAPAAAPETLSSLN